MTNPSLEINNLSVSYKINGRWLPAVRDFHLHIAPGQIYGLVGESGSGKSTIAKAVMNYLDDNGRFEDGSGVRFMGRDLCQLSRREMRPIWGKDLKLVPQNPGAALNPSMRIGAQMREIGQRYLGLSRHDAVQRAIEMFRRVQMADPENVLERYPHQLSGGMQQRVVIAMALLTEPRLLVLDEPTTGLDVTTETVILDLIRELINDVGSAALYVTHDLGVVAQLCERVLVLYGGEIMADSDVSLLYGETVHPYTIGLLSSIPRPGLTKYTQKLPAIEGHPPSLRSLPPGCVFAPRCPVALPLCHEVKPALETTEPGRMVRCHRWQEIARGEISAVPEVEGGLAETDYSEARENLARIMELTKHFPVRRTLPEILRGEAPRPVRAVDGVNLSIQRGHTLGLVGESGSGKTTLSRVIIGLTERTSGEIELLGLSVRDTVRQRSEDVLAKLQMVFQNPQNSLNPYMTVRQTLRRPLVTLRGLSRRAVDAEVLRLLAAVNLRAEYADRYPNELSGGEKQRVVIARAFASQPDLVIADEPVSALDVSVQAAVLNLLARLQAENDTGYLFISHDLAVVGYLADYIAVMYLGQLFETGYARDMFTPPHHPYTEALLSAIPVADPAQKTEPLRLRDEVPSARDLPRGCRFHTRCPYKLGEICEREAPPWHNDGNENWIRCHIPPDELEVLQTRTPGGAQHQPAPGTSTSESSDS
ncbi:MAG: ABC transporter ATP-binding protein [Anaerolineae bacterium]|nr:ABC transporter ATP-binding protein [Anaerolineae bacterium]